MTSSVLPASTSEFIALQIARKLGDLDHARMYLEICDLHPIEQLIGAYRSLLRMKVIGQKFEDFQKRLLSPSTPTPPLASTRLAAIRADRRNLAAVLFSGVAVEHIERRHLRTDWDQASATAAAFMNWLLATLKVDGIVIERVENVRDVRRQHLTQISIGICRTSGIPVWDVSHAMILGSFGAPPPKNNSELRTITASIWPMLNTRSGGNWTLDAAALGLYFQVERLLSHQH